MSTAIIVVAASSSSYNMKTPNRGSGEIDSMQDIDINLINEEEEEDILSDYDHSLDISSEDNDDDEGILLTQQQRSTQKLQMQSQPIMEGTHHTNKEKAQFHNHNRRSQSSTTSHDEEKDSVIILSAVDGTLAGISRTSGQMLWKQSRDGIHNNNVATKNKNKNKKKGKLAQEAPVEWSKFLSPLVSSNASTEKQKQTHQSSWHAVPSVDGTLYLTGGGNENEDSTTAHELSDSTHIRDLVDRAPFVDAQQRFFVGSRRAMVAAIDEKTGEILRVIPKWNQSDGDDDDDDGNNNNDEQLPPSLEGRDVVWIGRLEHTLTVHDLHKGTVDVEISVAEMLSVDEMIHGSGSSNSASDSTLVFRDEGEDKDDDSTHLDEEMERLFTDYITEALRHPNDGDRILRLPAPDESKDENDVYSDSARGRSSMGQGSSSSAFLVSTPSGNVAFRDDSDSPTMGGWVSFALLDSPVIYAIEASSGLKIRVNMLDDSSVSPATSIEGSLPQLLQQQIASLEQSSTLSDIDKACREDQPGECRAVGFSTQGLVVGALQNGQIYALPLGERISRPQLPLGLPHPHSDASAMANSNTRQQSKLNTQHAAIGFHEHQYDSSDDVDVGDNQRQQIIAQHSCTPGNPLYPGCLIGAGASLMMANLLDVNGNLDMAKLANHIDLLQENNRKNITYSQYFIKILTSWIAPTVALIFVLSFEMGRRQRLKRLASGEGNATEEDKDAPNSNINNQGGVIQLSDEILGYGGHGTVVYRGVLDKRQVAVKRLLAMYHASADREISLLIESDGHPNVVRYFLKEVRGDFVYLALELCNMSLNDLIVSLSKLKNNMRKGSIDGDFESATKSLLFQIASGVRHIHSLRIVHRDLKPQNILLALRNATKSVAITKPEERGSDSESDFDDTTHSTCSDTNTILECFKNQEYVPKISDMGLGKQLAGQSSFGLSTLGTGSVGVADAGAGAGSVGWQAPEVMAQRWSPETSDVVESTSRESSPLEVGVNRTSRSVDIFSLGCIFYCTILPGSHPFGEWYEREANIMKNSPNKEDLEFVSPDASDLIRSMISRDAKARPTADEVCEHPFFWSPSKRLKFLCDLSDRIEMCDMGNADNSLPIYAIEKGAANVFGTSWEKELYPELMEASVSRRTYDPSSVRDCLRMIRNKHHHYDELPASLKNRIGTSTDGLSNYITRTFPRLMMHCYHFCVTNLASDDSLVSDYKLPTRDLSPKSKEAANVALITDLSALNETQPLETIQDHDAEIDPEETGDVSSQTPELEEESYQPDEKLVRHPTSGELEGAAPQAKNEDLSGIVVWSGSNTAKELKCRGWYRSEDDWTQRLDAKLRKSSNLVKLAEDTKFRTRLCNHWDVSKGTHCPMRKKNKCIFAHGPVELRVKEGKRNRWGKLVNKKGECANTKASGGEDTYGAARNIETTRKEQGQWANDSKQKKQQGKGNKKQSPNKKKKEQTS